MASRKSKHVAAVLINYISSNKVVLDCKFMHFVKNDELRRPCFEEVMV